MPSQFFTVPEGTLDEVRYLNFLRSNRLQKAYEQLIIRNKSINVNSIIDGESLFSHTINAFSLDRSNAQAQFIKIIWLMINCKADLNGYDSNKKVTYFTRLCHCNITDEFLSLMLSAGAWVNPEIERPNQIFSLTPLAELATNFEVSLVNILLEAHANPNSVVFHSGAAYTSIINYVITTAADNYYFEETILTETISEILASLLINGAEVDNNSIALLKSEFKNYPFNTELHRLLQTLKDHQEKFPSNYQTISS